MRRKVTGFVNVRAVSGTHVVFLAFDMKESDAKNLMGFAIQRRDLTEDETVWLRGNKSFPSIRPSTGLEPASSHEHPGEFMRLFAHHRFRESVKRHIEQFGTAAVNTWKPQDLFEDWKKWMPMHFRAGSEKDIKRRYFAGS